MSQSTHPSATNRGRGRRADVEGLGLDTFFEEEAPTIVDLTTHELTLHIGSGLSF